MKPPSFSYIWAAGITLLLLIGAAGFYWFTSPNLLIPAKSTINPTTTIFVSKQSPIMVSLLANPEHLIAQQKGKSRQQWEQFKQSLLSNTNLDYKQDIQPWLGDELTLAVTNLDDINQKNSSQPGYLLIATTKNAARSREFLQLFWQQQTNNADLVFEDYQGVKLIYKNQKNSPVMTNGLATAAVGNSFILFANHPKVLREAINNVQAAELNINNDESYQLALQNFSPSRLALAFVNLQSLSTHINNSKLPNSRYKSLAIALSPNPQGLIAETALLSALNQQNINVSTALTEPVEALKYIPKNSAFTAASKDLEKLGRFLKNNENLLPIIKKYLADIESHLKISLSENIFNWVDGEYALAMLPRMDNVNPDWIFVVEKSKLATSGIANLDIIAKDKGLNIESISLENQNISAWTKLLTSTTKNQVKNSAPVILKTEVEGVHATRGKYEILTTSLEAMEQVLKLSEPSLADSVNFKEAIAPLPKPNNGYLYIDWGQSKSFLEQQFPLIKVFELVGKPFFDNLRSLSLSSYAKESKIQRSQIFIRLAGSKS